MVMLSIEMPFFFLFGISSNQVPHKMMDEMYWWKSVFILTQIIIFKSSSISLICRNTHTHTNPQTMHWSDDSKLHFSYTGTHIYHITNIKHQTNQVKNTHKPTKTQPTHFPSVLPPPSIFIPFYPSSTSQRGGRQTNKKQRKKARPEITHEHFEKIFCKI